MISKDDVFKKILEADFKKGSFSERICKLIIENEFDKYLNSQQLVSLYNDGPGKKIKTSQLTAFIQPLLNQEIIKVKTLKNNKRKTKLWFPAWLYGKEIFNFQDTKISLNKIILDNLPIEIKDVIIDDADEANRCFSVRAWKSICMLCGRITESIMLYYIDLFEKQNPGNKKIKDIIGKMQRHQQIGYDLIIETSQDIGIIKTNEMTKSFSDLVISCRHPSVHFRNQKLMLNEKKAKTVMNSTEIIFEDIYKNADQLGLIKN